MYNENRDRPRQYGESNNRWWGSHTSKISRIYENLLQEHAETFTPHRPIDHIVELKVNYNQQSGRIDNLSDVKLQKQNACIEIKLANSFKRLSSSSATTPILLTNNNDCELSISGNYWDSNLGMMHNRYRLPLISELLHPVHNARIITQLYLQTACPLNLIGKASSSGLICDPAIDSLISELSLWVDNFTSVKSRFLCWLSTALHWWLHQMLHWWYYHLLDHWRGARRRCPKSATTLHTLQTP